MRKFFVFFVLVIFCGGCQSLLGSVTSHASLENGDITYSDDWSGDPRIGANAQATIDIARGQREIDGGIAAVYQAHASRIYDPGRESIRRAELVQINRDLREAREAWLETEKRAIELETELEETLLLVEGAEAAVETARRKVTEAEKTAAEARRRLEEARAAPDSDSTAKAALEGFKLSVAEKTAAVEEARAELQASLGALEEARAAVLSLEEKKLAAQRTRRVADILKKRVQQLEADRDSLLEQGQASEDAGLALPSVIGGGLLVGNYRMVVVNDSAFDLSVTLSGTGGAQTVALRHGQQKVVRVPSGRIRFESRRSDGEIHRSGWLYVNDIINDVEHNRVKYDAFIRFTR